METQREYVFPCGLRLVYEPSASGVVYCGYVVCAGTRHEEPSDSGMAHFIEHMSFKGTARRRACHISNGLERVGGDLNAFTNKQETVYYAAVLRPDFERAVDLLTDVVFRSTYPQHEIDREVEVICDEIESYKDSPSDLIFDEFEAMVFRGSPLGRDVLGDAARLRSYRTEDALRFARRWYRPQNAVFYVYGQLDFERVVRIVGRHVADLCDETAGSALLQAFPAAFPPIPAYEPEEREVKRGTHQAHVVVGARAFGGSDPQLYALRLLNNMLGGPGMNSRLNTSLREKAGLVYSVDSYVYTYTDTGLWCAYFGCDVHDVVRCRRMLVKELRRFTDDLLTPTQLAAAKRQLKGQLGIARDGFESYATTLGKNYARYGELYDLDRELACIENLTAQQLRDTAEAVYDPARLTTLVYL